MWESQDDKKKIQNQGEINRKLTMMNVGELDSQDDATKPRRNQKKIDDGEQMRVGMMLQNQGEINRKLTMTNR